MEDAFRNDELGPAEDDLIAGFRPGFTFDEDAAQRVLGALDALREDWQGEPFLPNYVTGDLVLLVMLINGNFPRVSARPDLKARFRAYFSDVLDAIEWMSADEDSVLRPAVESLLLGLKEGRFDADVARVILDFVDRIGREQTAARVHPKFVARDLFELVFQTYGMLDSLQDGSRERVGDFFAELQDLVERISV